MAKKKGSKIDKMDLFVLGVGAVALFSIFANRGINNNNVFSGGGTGTNTGTGTGSNTGTGTGSGTGLSIWAGGGTPEQWSDSWQKYAIASCYIDCSDRYHVLQETNTKLSDAQLVDVSNVLKTRTGKNMKQHMENMSWYGGSYTNNAGDLLFNRLKNLPL